MKAEEIARVVHEANRALTQILRDVPVQPSWDDAGEDMRGSSIRGVRLAFQLMDTGVAPELRPLVMHQEWRKERLAQGWVFGEVKDVEKKTHPAMRPYAELPEGTRSKDIVFLAIVAALR